MTKEQAYDVCIEDTKYRIKEAYEKITELEHYLKALQEKKAALREENKQ